MAETIFLDVGEAADYLRLTSKQTLYNMVSQGRIPFRKLGSRLLFEKNKLAAWVQSGCPSPAVLNHTKNESSDEEAVK